MISSRPDAQRLLYAPDGGSVANIGGAPTTSTEGMSPIQSAPASRFSITISWDPSVSWAPSGFTAAVLNAARYLETRFTDPVTINLSIGYGEVNRTSMQDALGATQAYISQYSYSSLLAAIMADSKSTDDRTTAKSLPSSAPISGTFWATTAQAKALGLASPSDTMTDAYIGFSDKYQFTYNNSDGVAPGTYDFNGVALHEMTEAMGRMMFTGKDIAGFSNSFDFLDLLHYSGNNTPEFSATAPGYLSFDHGFSTVGQFNINSPGDAGDWSSSMGHDAFDAFTSPGVINPATVNDLREMDVLGWDAPATSAALTTPSHPIISGIVGVPYTGVRILGTSDPDSTVTLRDTMNGKTGVLGSAVVATDGAWNFMSVSGLGHIDLSAVHHYSVTADDAAGNTGTTSGGLILTDAANDVLDAITGVPEVFAIMSNLGSDIIHGFQPASRAGSSHDVLNFSGRGLSSFNQVQTIMTGNSSTIFTLPAGKTVTLTDVAPSWLAAADFRFT